VSIPVLLFGGAADLAGARSVRLSIDGAATPAAVLEALARAVPALAPIVPTARLAVNHEFARPDRIIAADDEVALIAMVSGG